mgnify:CR=1 FL=1
MLYRSRLNVYLAETYERSYCQKIIIYFCSIKVNNLINFAQQFFFIF